MNNPDDSDKQTKLSSKTAATDSPLTKSNLKRVSRHSLENFERKQEDPLHSNSYYETRIDKIVTILEKFTNLTKIFKKDDGTIPYTVAGLMVKDGNALQMFLNFFKNSNKISFVHIRLLQMIIRENSDFMFIAKVHDLIRYRLENKNEVFNLIYPNNQYGLTGNLQSNTTMSEVFETRFLTSAVEKHGKTDLEPLIKLFNSSLFHHTGKKLDGIYLKNVIENYVKSRNLICKIAVYHLCSVYEKTILKILLTEFNSDENYVHSINSQASICYYNSYGSYGQQRGTSMVRLLAIPNNLASRENAGSPARSTGSGSSPCFYDNSSSGGSSPSYMTSSRENSSTEEGIVIERHTLVEKSPFFQAMLRAGSFREANQEIIDIVQCTEISLVFIVHVLSGCRNCDVIKSPDINKANAGEILELANRFLLDEGLLTFVESTGCFC